MASCLPSISIKRSSAEGKILLLAKQVFLMEQVLSFKRLPY